MADIFLSYASEDHERARRMATALEARGWTLWWDRNIAAGEAFDEVIEHELTHAKCVVVLWSKASVASEWVRNEAAMAAERRVLIPALIEAVKLPLEFRRRQTVDLIDWNGNDADQQFNALCEGVAAAAGAASVQKVPAAAVPPAASLRRRRWPLGALAVLVFLAVGGALWINRIDPKKLNAAFVVAAAQGQAQNVRAMLGRGADVAIVGPKALEKAASLRYSAPYGVSERDQVETLRALLEAGVGPNNRYDEGLTALMLVVRGDSDPLEAVKTLLERSAEVNAKCDCSVCDPRMGSQGCTALMIAAMRGHRDSLSVLLDRGAHVDDKTDANRTALMLTGNADIVRVLLERGADPNIPDNQGKTALMWAVDSFGAGLAGVQALLKGGADVRAKDTEGKTALGYAAVAGNDEIVGTLLDTGADINAKTDKAMTPLMLATINGHSHVVRDLVKRGASLNGQNYAGKTALQLAQDRLKGEVRDEIIHLLRRGGAK